LGDYQNIRILTRPEVIQFDDVRIIMMPWICADTVSESMDMIQNTSAECLFGHLELDGFEMYKGQPMHGGLPSHLFSKFELVCSGHFHTRSQVGNIRYLGSPYEMSWSDYDDPRGFHIFNTEDRSMDFQKNPNRMFYKVYYNDEDKKQPLRVDGQGKPDLKDKYVKVIVENKSDSRLFEKIINKLYAMQPHEMKVIEVIEDITSTAKTDGIDVEDTITLLDNYVDGMEIGLEKTRLKSTLSSLYVEARALEEEV
jgi:DNA repair exonuclease SbcCD nuclease subunit